MWPNKIERQSESSETTAPLPYSAEHRPSLDPRASTSGDRQGQRWRRWPLLIATALFVLVQIGPWSLSSLGLWLVVEDEIEQADVIFVHAGGIPFRAIEAAELYQLGHAPKIWIASLCLNDQSRALEHLGLRRPGLHYWEREILQRLGVPGSAIRVLGEQVKNTRDEIRVVRDDMRRLGLSSVILVTSKVHSRRVRTLWNQADDTSIEGIVRWARADPFDPVRWWTNTTDGQSVVHELAGMLDAWTGAGWRPERE